MAKRGETIVLQASRRYKLWLASAFVCFAFLLMGIFYLTPKRRSNLDDSFLALVRWYPGIGQLHP